MKKINLRDYYPFYTTDTIVESLIDRLINRVYVFPGDRIEIEYVTQDFLGTEKSGKEA